MSPLVRDQRGRPLPLIRLIGKGGQADVWASEGRIAVKLMHARGKRAAERVSSRIRVVRRLDLDGVPVSRPLDLLGAPDVGYSMELLEGMIPIKSLAAPPEGADLLEWYGETGGLGRRLRLLARAADALAQLHARGLVYADPSPGNILISEEERYSEVRLVDVDFLQSESLVLESAATPGYAAPEVLIQRSGVTGTSDAFAFAVIAFEVLALTHPFLGDQVHLGEVEMLERAYAGELPWIDHPDDDSNRSRYGIPRGAVLVGNREDQRVRAGSVADCARMAFMAGVHQPGKRPSVAEWRTALYAAADMLLDCIACGRAKDARLTKCPWCGMTAPHPLVAVVYSTGPGGGFMRLGEGLAVPEATWLPLTARTARGESGDGSLSVLAWLWWEPDVRIVLRNDDTTPLWLAPEGDPGGTAVIDPGREVAVCVQGSVPRWALHFGVPGLPHRVLRFASRNTDSPRRQES